jgi:hypothetical protein
MKLTHYLNPGPGALLACRLLVEKYCLLLGGAIIFCVNSMRKVA